MGTLILGGLAGYGAVHLIFNATAVTNSIRRTMDDVREEFGGDLRLVSTLLIPTTINAVAWFFAYSLILTYRGAMQDGFMIYPVQEDDDA